MDRQDVEDIVEAMLDERGISIGGAHNDDVPTSVIPIRQFSAFGEMGTPVEVIGVGYFNGITQFLIIDEADGAIFPIFRENVFKDQKSAESAFAENGAQH